MLTDDTPTEPTGPIEDDRLRLIFTCCHPALALENRVAMTLRLLGGLTVAEIAAAFLVPETTMAQRITRAKKTVSSVRFDAPGDVATVLRVLYLVFNEGYSGEVDLAVEAIRLTRQLAAATGHREWDRVLPPMAEVAMPEREWLVRDFLKWDAGLPPNCQTFAKGSGATEKTPRLALVS